MKFSVYLESWPLREPFRISAAEWTQTDLIVVRLDDGRAIGRGEAQGIDYLGETPQSMLEQVHSIAEDIRQGISRSALQSLLPAGGARNAVDCALWDLECKQSGQSIWQLTGIQPKPITTVFTIGLEDGEEAMAAKAAAAAGAPILKIKLDRHQPSEKLAAIRAARPDAQLVVDANQGWDFPLLLEVIRRCVPLRIAMIEQPLPRGNDAELEGFESPIILAADESCLDTGDLETAAPRYGMINIKLDKTGGLTEAFNLAQAARAKGCKLMVGNMVGTSLAMAPSFVLAQLCDFADIDGPLLLKNDRKYGLRYSNCVVESLDSVLWG